MMPNAEANKVCQTPGCVDSCPDPSDLTSSCVRYCKADPGTRYIELAKMFGIGENGFVDTICQQDFSETMEGLATFVDYPRELKLSDRLDDVSRYAVAINGRIVPRYSCSNSDQENVVKCEDTTDDTSCSGGSCVETWSYTPPEDLDPPDEDAPGGVITFAEHYNPYKLISSGEILIELLRLTE